VWNLEQESKHTKAARPVIGKNVNVETVFLRRTAVPSGPVQDAVNLNIYHMRQPRTVIPKHTRFEPLRHSTPGPGTYSVVSSEKRPCSKRGTFENSKRELVWMFENV
jgi:hypothetical protein